MRSHVDFLASRDYYAISFDPPGTWESEGYIGQHTMTSYLKAIDELIEYYGNKPTLLMGHSLGGLMAALAAARNPHVTSFIAAMSPHALVRTEHGEERAAGWPLAKWRAARLRPSDRDLPGNPTQKKHFDLPYSFAEDALQYNSLEVLGKVTIPKLFIAGEHDDKIRPEVVRATYDVAARPKQFVMLDSDHDYRWHADLIGKVNDIMGEFLEGNNA